MKEESKKRFGVLPKNTPDIGRDTAIIKNGGYRIILQIRSE